jgi:hypothetical protein
MTTVKYALIKNKIVKNIVVFDDPSQELLDQFKQDLDLDDIVIADQYATIDGSYADSVFIPAAPYPSWVWDKENKVFNPPIPMPLDNKPYTWDEKTQQWVLLVDGANNENNLH